MRLSLPVGGLLLLLIIFRRFRRHRLTPFSVGFHGSHRSRQHRSRHRRRRLHRGRRHRRRRCLPPLSKGSGGDVGIKRLQILVD